MRNFARHAPKSVSRSEMGIITEIHIRYTAVLRKKPYEPADVAKFPLIDYEFTRKFIKILLPVSHRILLVLKSEVPENVKGKYS